MAGERLTSKPGGLLAQFAGRACAWRLCTISPSAIVVNGVSPLVQSSSSEKCTQFEMSVRRSSHTPHAKSSLPLAGIVTSCSVLAQSRTTPTIILVQPGVPDTPPRSWPSRYMFWPRSLLMSA